MKIAIYTVDLYPGRERLMPWRTLIEVAKEMINNNFQVEILTASVERDNESYTYQGLTIKVVPRKLSLLASFINEREYDVIYFPLTWRDNYKKLSDLKIIKCKKIGYFPGGVYQIKNVLALIRWGGIKHSKAYVLEYFSSQKRLIRKLEKANFSSFIGLTELTSKTLVSANAKNVETIYPGKDNFEILPIDFSSLTKNNLEGEKYFLFMGAPAVTRGSQCLLQSFDKFADLNSDAKIVFLMRTDVGSKYTEFNKAYKKLKNKEKVLIVNATLSPAELKAYISSAWAVTLPFLVIPSEVPITYLEVLSCGTPIVTFENGGTTEYFKNAILSGVPGNEASLFDMLNLIWNNTNLRNELSNNAKAIMSKHPRWDIVANDWIKMITGI